MSINLSKQTLRQWLTSHEFRKSVAVQVTSGLIITAIVTIIGLGIHELRSDDPEPRPAVAHAAPASEPTPKPVAQPKPQADTSSPGDRPLNPADPLDRFAENTAVLAAWVFGGLMMLVFVSFLMRGLLGIR